MNKLNLVKYKSAIIATLVLIPLVSFAGYYFVENQNSKNDLKKIDQKARIQEERVNKLSRSNSKQEEQKEQESKEEKAEMKMQADNKEANISATKQATAAKIESKEDCLESAFYCKQKINEAGAINYTGDYIYIGRIETLESQKSRVENLIDRWEDDKDDCADDDCEEDLEEKIEDAEDDIEDAEDLVAEAEAEVEGLLAGECSGYDQFCK